MSNPVVWSEVMGQDADRLRSFYRRLLSRKFRLENPARFEAVDAAQARIQAGVAQIQADGDWAKFYTKVNDIEAAVELAHSLGSTIRVPVTELPDSRIAVVTDPEGNAVGLCADK